MFISAKLHNGQPILINLDEVENIYPPAIHQTGDNYQTPVCYDKNKSVIVIKGSDRTFEVDKGFTWIMEKMEGKKMIISL